MRLEGKVTLIAGAGSITEIPGLPGIGRATAILFAQEGAKVVAADIRPRAGEKTVNMIRERGGDAVFVQGDVTRAEDAKRMVETTVSTYGKLDILHNNVGIGLGGNVVDTSEEDWDGVIGTNLKGIFLARAPLGRIGLAQDIAYGVIYLASDEASYVTGTTLVIDEGESFARREYWEYRERSLHISNPVFPLPFQRI